MKRLILLLAFIATPVPAQEPQGMAPDERPAGNRAGNSYANPSAVIAAELAFAQSAQDNGQWTAFAASAAPDAVLFRPQMVWAQQWLDGRANPAVARTRQPHEVWSSCDGAVVVSHGAWQETAEFGWFTTVWQRQPDGAYKWVLDHGDVLQQALPAPDMLSAHVADCPERVRRPGGPRDGERARPKRTKKVKLKDLPPLDPVHRAGIAPDGSLHWDITVAPDGSRTFAAFWNKDGQEQTALAEQVTARPHRAP
ncbi:MAG: hypothetical protein FP826_11165 [Sphingomonadales bacterium]|nr:hypothetical protein [Sphingomonadales bacterium]MBU3992711.1 hypothetical protein [Alphaproteobacteria bacterium]